MPAAHQSVSITFRHCCLHSILIFKLSSPVWGKTSINFHIGARLIPHLSPVIAKFKQRRRPIVRTILINTVNSHSYTAEPAALEILSIWISGTDIITAVKINAPLLAPVIGRLTHVILVNGRQGHFKGLFNSSPFLIIICTLYCSEKMTTISLKQEAVCILEKPLINSRGLI